MKDFGKTILNRLLDKYENSVLSKGGSERKLSISLSLKDKELATYCAVNSYDYRSRNDSVLAEYEKNGFIVVKRDKFCDFESLTLNIGRVDEIYHFLNRANPGKELEKVGQILSDEEEIGLVGKYIESCRDWIKKKHSFPKSFNSIL